MLSAIVATVIILTAYVIWKNHRTETPVDTAKLEQQRVEASRINSLTEALKQKEEIQRASNVAAQREAKTQVQALEKKLESIHKETEALVRDAELLRTGELGKRLASRPELVQTATYFFEHRTREIPSPQSVANALAQARMLTSKLDQANDAYRPDESFRKEVDSLSESASTYRSNLDSVSNHYGSLKRSAESIDAHSVTTAESLNDTMKRTNEAITAANQQEAARKMAEVKRANDAANADITVNEVQVAGDIQTTKRKIALDRTRKLAEQRKITDEVITDDMVRKAEADRDQQITSAEHAARVAEARRRRSEFEAKLKPFFSLGYWQPSKTRARETVKQPMSLTAIRSFGALKDGDSSLTALARLGTMAYNDRPKWDRDMHDPKKRARSPTRDRLIEAQRLLIEFGDAFVELGYLIE